MAKAQADTSQNNKNNDSEGKTDGKTKALGLALESIEKQFGKGSIMKLGESHHAECRNFPYGGTQS